MRSCIATSMISALLVTLMVGGLRRPQAFRHQWDDVPDSGQSALGSAEALAAAMRAKQEGD